MAEQWTVRNQADTESHIYKAGYRQGVAETEAAWPCPNCLPCSQCENISHDERVNGAALAAALRNLHYAIDDFNASGVYETALCALPQCKALGFNATGGIIHVDNCAIVIARSALAKHNASQGPEASHAE